MSYKIELHDLYSNNIYDITNRTLQITVDEKLDSESNTFKITCKSIQLNHKFNVITVKYNNVSKHSGIVLNQSDRSSGDKLKITEFDCVDWSFLFNVRIVAESYLPTDIFQGRPDLILKHYINKYLPELSTNNVRPCYSTTIEKLFCPYVYAMEATKKLMDYIPNWHWYVDANKDVHFFEGYESEGVTFGSDSNGRYNFLRESLNVKYIGTRTANRIWVVGAKQSSPKYIEQYFTGDGQQRFFTLAYEPNSFDVYVNGSLKKSKLEGNDDGEQDFLINKKEKVFYIPNNILEPFTGSIKVKYKPTVQVVDYFDKANEASKLLIEKVIKNKDIVDRASARQFGKAEIKRKSVDSRVISLVTRDSVTIGQKCHVNIVYSDWNVVGNFLVKSVNTTITDVDEVRSIEMEELV